MAAKFETFRRLYDNNQFTELVRDPDGIFWLKLRSISRSSLLKQLCQKADINYEGISGRHLLPHVFNNKPSQNIIDEFIHETYEAERITKRENEDHLISQLYQMKVFDWGGLYQNSLEQTIINNYVKQIRDWDKLNKAIENELHISMRGYVQCSWYNHWTSIIIEDIFRDHPVVLPAVGLVKKVDFFIHGFSFDLKVTYFPDGYMRKLRRDEGLRPEFTDLKAFCRQEGIWFDKSKPENVLFPELLAKITEYPSQNAKDFMQKFKATRTRLIQQTIQNPTPLKIWLYENQGVRRFDAANRFFLILINQDNLEDSWKLKRNKVLLTHKINAYLDSIEPEAIEKLELEFYWENKVYKTYADTLFISTE
jgi:hypothetical protein